MGRKLRPFSACHSVLLRSLKIHVLTLEDLSLPTLEIISLICSQRMPDGDLRRACQRQLVEGLWLEVDLEALYDAERENDELEGWLGLCYASRPCLRILKGLVGGGTWECRMGDEKHMIQSLLKHTHGYTRDGLWYDLPLGELHWEYQQMQELRDEQALITIHGEPEPEETAEEKAAEARFLLISGKILARYVSALSALGKPGTKRYKEKAPALAAEKKELMALARAGRMAEDLSLLQPPEATP